MASLVRPANRRARSARRRRSCRTPRPCGAIRLLSDRARSSRSRTHRRLPPEGYGGDPTIVAAGHAAGLSPSRTVITDNQRIIETVGTRLDWVCSGTRVLDVAWQNNDAEAMMPGYPGIVPVMRRPFSRPAKAIRLTRANFLAPYTNSLGTLWSDSTRRSTRPNRAWPDAPVSLDSCPYRHAVAASPNRASAPARIWSSTRAMTASSRSTARGGRSGRWTTSATRRSRRPTSSAPAEMAITWGLISTRARTTRRSC